MFKDQFDKIRNMFLRIRDDGRPEVINDGDVTALAGAMSLEDTGTWASPWVPARRRATST